MLTILLATALAATAQDGSPPPSFSPATLLGDANGDGVVTREEHLAQAGSRFDRFDLNRDGKLTADELESFGLRLRGTPATPPPGR